MKFSEYIQWAKKHHDIKYNLAVSGLPAPALHDLVDDPQEILESGDHKNGWLQLMECIAQRYEVETDQVVPVHSASFANHLACALLLEPGDEVLVEEPAYEPLVSLPKYFNTTVKRFSRSPDQNFQPDPLKIGKRLSGKTKLIILSDLHNPSGVLLDKEKLQKIIEFAEDYEFHLLIDEVYLEFLYPQGARTAANLSNQIITTRSLTKAFGLDDIRVGWIIAEASKADKIRKLQDLFMTSMALPSERLGTIALDKADEMLEQNLELLSENFILVKQFVNEHTKLSWQAPKYGSVGFVKYEPGYVDDLVEHALANYNTLVAPGRFFGMAEYFRIGWGMPTEILEEGLNRLSKSMDEQ
jgi:aspartate/methionine/tyrosine aminotransferase